MRMEQESGSVGGRRRIGGGMHHFVHAVGRFTVSFVLRRVGADGNRLFLLVLSLYDPADDMYRRYGSDPFSAVDENF